MSTEFYQGWLLAFVYWTGIALGALALQLIHSLSSGRWGDTIRTQARALSSTLPFMAIGFVGVYLGRANLYPWARGEHNPWVSDTSFLARGLVYFLVWTLINTWLSRQSRRFEKTGDPAVLDELQTRSGPLMVLWLFTSSLASVDWLMTLMPQWYSTMFGFLIAVTQLLSAMALCTVLVCTIQLKKEQLYDIGTMLLVFVMATTYLAYSEWIIIWCGDLPHETIFFRQRLVGGWQVQAGLLLAFECAMPFVLLIFGGFKTRQKPLRTLAGWLLVTHLVYLHWVISPISRTGWSVSLFDILLPLAFGVCFGAIAKRQLKADGPAIERAYAWPS